MKKRILTLLTAIVMVFALAACGGGKTLESVLSSSDWKEAAKEWNDSVSGYGITITNEADGNTLVFTWHLPADGLYSELDSDTCGVMSDSFLGTLESSDFLTAFKTGYGVTLDAVRCVFVTSDGSEIYRDELTK
ncbi:MAG: DUF4854 domain-containing protein [Firmicutes bacterium]|nr:DUF4854 domain-containing protein [Bacillota bacterium]